MQFYFNHSVRMKLATKFSCEILKQMKKIRTSLGRIEEIFKLFGPREKS